MSRGMLRCCTTDPGLRRCTVGWMVGDVVKIVNGVSKDVVRISQDGYEDAFTLSHDAFVIDDSGRSRFNCLSNIDLSFSNILSDNVDNLSSCP